MNKSAILKGVKNFVFKKESIEEIAKKRKVICDDCEHNSKGTPNRCKVCGCIIQFKIRQSIQTCPKGKW